MSKQTKEEREKLIRELSAGVLSLARDNILISLRFLDVALTDLKFVENGLQEKVAMQGKTVYYDGVQILKDYEKNQKLINRMLLHVLLHGIFFHPFSCEKLDPELWEMATDMAVESVIIEMDLPGFALETDKAAANKLRVWREDAGGLTAEKLYRFMKINPVSPTEKGEIRQLFYRDSHRYWQATPEIEIARKDFERIAERIKADLRSFTNLKKGGEAVSENLETATRDRYDYGKILEGFMVMGEDMSVNDEEFDYVYYTYGLKTYGNMPLVEPLEYKDTRKIKDFVIAIDTSASCKGALVRAFLNKTYSILKSRENFFSKVNIHLIQCDNQVQKDVKITCDEDFDEFMKNGKLVGFGGTDYRPVFEHVDELVAKGEFENLKGLIYFTDGYGIYPERMRNYRTIFAFLEEDRYRQPVPPWCMKVVLEEEDLEEEQK